MPRPWLALFLALAAGCSATGGDVTGSGSRLDGDAGSSLPDDDDAAPGDEGDAGDPWLDDDDASIPDATSDHYCEGERHETTRHPVDIVFVIDNSGSMSNEIKSVRENINAFASKIANSGLDYRLFMISQKGTSSYAVCVPEPLANPNCETKPPRFYAINQTVASTNALALLLSTFDNKNDPLSAWNKYVRYDSIKFFVIVTDDNSSLSAANFEAQLFQKMPAGIFGTEQDRKYIFNSIVGWDGLNTPPTTLTQKCSTAANSGRVYQELSVLTGGVVEAICKDDWSKILDTIADGVVKALGCEFQVPQPQNGSLDPDLVEVQLSLDGAAPTTMPRVLDEASCSVEPGAFYFDSNTAPTEVKLCPAACSQVSADPKAEVSVLVGCPAPPPR